MQVQESDDSIVQDFREETKREAAFTRLVCKYRERLYWHVRRLVVEHEDANDILQNTFVKVWQHLGSFRQEANLYTWLYRIASNESLNWIEQQKRRSSLPLDKAESFLAEKLVAQKGFDERRIEWKLQQAIQSLPEKQRLVFTLRYYDEMPYAQMAEVLETSEGALKASYHHAVKKVEEYLLR